MVCDLVDSTRFAGQFDPEEFREVVRAYHQVCAQVIQRFDGSIAQSLSHRLLAYFGYPLAHEDAAHRAVRAGLGILAALGARQPGPEREVDFPLAVRIGIHTGLVVIDDIGTGSGQAPLALGQTPDIAAHIQRIAASDSVVISAATYRLIQGYFLCAPLGTYTFSGVTPPLGVYRVLQDSGAQSHLDVAMTRGLTPLVGRASEVTLLLERWRQAAEGMGQVIVLSGEAGIGKSRLVQILKDHVTQEGYTLLECRCSPYYQHSMLSPIIDLLQRLLPWHPDDVPEAKLAKLEQILRNAHLALAETVPLLAALLSLPLPANRYPPLGLSPERQRHQTLGTLIALVLARTTHKPLLFIVEDLHWSDPSTLELLSLVIDQGPTTSLYTLLTCRPTFQPPWGFRAHITPLALNRLSRAQVEIMIAYMASGTTLPAEVMQQLVEKTDGVPLFIEEMTKAVLESEWLQEPHRHDTLRGPLPALTVPPTLQDSLTARLDRLGTAKGVAQLGATLGREFPYALLKAAAQVEEAILQQELKRLVDAELLYQRGIAPQATYVFKHALIQEAAYQSLLRSTRQHYHLRIAQVLEGQFLDVVETQPELLAQHYTGASLSERAVPYWQQAGTRAFERAAFREAVTAFEQALQALAHLPESDDTRGRAIELRLAVDPPLSALGAYGRRLALLGEAEVLARALDDHARLGRVLARMGQARRQTGDHEGAMAAGQQALALAAALSDSALQVQASYSLGLASYALGDFGRAAALLRQNVAAADREAGTLSTDLWIRSQAWLALTLSDLGAFAEGRRYGEEALRRATLAGREAIAIIVHGCLGSLYLAQGDLEPAIQVSEQGLALCRASGNRDWLRGTAASLGYAAALQGRLAEAGALLEEAIRESLSTGAQQDRALWVARLSEVCRLAGRGAEAWQHARQALDLARQLKERGNEARALHQLGTVQAHADPPDTAQAKVYYQQALALAEALGIRPLQAHCHRGLGTLYATTGQPEQARAALSTAIDVYMSMAMSFWLPETEAALAQLAGC
jgi:class 3 adenylate cyclase/tetratricopeptide (TPR) repeat protein